MGFGVERLIWNAVGRACGRVEGRGAHAFSDHLTAEYVEVETGTDRSAFSAWIAYSTVQVRAGLTTKNTNHTKSEAQGNSELFVSIEAVSKVNAF